MMLEVALIRHAKQGVQQAAVAYVDLRGLHLAFAEILEPRGKLPDHEHALIR
jgi:hypothetical protein